MGEWVYFFCMLLVRVRTSMQPPQENYDDPAVQAMYKQETQQQQQHPDYSPPTCKVCGFVYQQSGYPFPNISKSHNEDWEYCHHCMARVQDLCTKVPGMHHMCAYCAEPLVSFQTWLSSKQCKKGRQSPPEDEL